MMWCMYSLRRREVKEDACGVDAGGLCLCHSYRNWQIIASGPRLMESSFPLRYRLTSGDMIDILTSSSQVPHKGWLKFVRTSRARAKIKHWFKVEENKRALEIGHRLLERECRRHGIARWPRPSSQRRLLTIGQEKMDMRLSRRDDKNGRIWPNFYPPLKSINLLEPPSSGFLRTEKAGPESAPVSILKKHQKPKEERSVKVKGGNDVLMQLSKCCNPVPGDQIMGYITRGRGLTIHSVGCPNLQGVWIGIKIDL